MTRPQLGAFLRQAALFGGIGLALYAGVYYAAERINDRTTVRNPFHAVATAPRPSYDFAILGASHALPLGFEDMNERLERATGASVLNLATPGGGLVVNRLVLDYLLERRTVGTVVYVLDSFVFYSREWNEERLRDVRLFRRAAFDPRLARLLVRRAASGEAPPSVALDYLSGFSKVNNPERFRSDVPEDERLRFGRVYRPSSRDAARIDYLYPKTVDPAALERYLAQLTQLIDELERRGIALVVVRPPLPARFRERIPDEAAFERTLRALLERRHVAYHDFSGTGNEPRYFFDTDHLNRDGVANFIDRHLAPVLRSGAPAALASRRAPP